MAEQDDHGTTIRSVEDAPAWSTLDQTLADVRTCFADLQPEAVEDLVDEAVTTVRHSRKLPTPKAGK